MRYMLHISLIVLSLMIASCGSGGGKGSISSGTTNVVINLGQRNINTGALSARAIPPEVSYIVIRISAPDESTIEQVVNISEGMESVEVVLVVPNGLWHFEVFAYDDTDTLRCYGDTYAYLDGTPATITITVVCFADETPPTFNGLETAEAFSETSIGLSWSAAVDDVTPSSAILYLIYMLTTSGGQDFAAPSFTTAAGATTYTVAGLSPSTTSCFVVRAKDEAGNIDSNTEERCATTFSPPIQEYTLTVTLGGNGSGTVTISPPGISCGGDCWEVYDEGMVVILTPTPDVGSYFAGWSGDPDCTNGVVTMDADKTCAATFIKLLQYTLTVTIAGQGIIDITSNPPGINCGGEGGNCSEAYDYGTIVTLSYILNDTFFCGWSGNPDCSDGQVTMDADKTCTANISWSTC